MHLKGTFTALITPFVNGELDEDGLIQNISRQIDAGISGLVFLGSTSEAATLTEAEQKRIVEIGVREAKGKAVVIVGTGSNSTRVSIENTQRAKDLGADAALVVTPYYNKPTQEGIFLHFEALTNAVDLPVIVYNSPGRTGTNIETNTLLRIAGLPHVIGVKDAGGDLEQSGDVICQITSKYPQFSVLSGDDISVFPMMALGGVGVISVSSNLVPEQMIALVNAALHENFIEARQIHRNLLKLFKLAFIESNPIPIKEAMNLAGMPAGLCRLPLCELRPENREKIKMLVSDLGLMPSCV